MSHLPVHQLPQASNYALPFVGAGTPPTGAIKHNLTATSAPSIANDNTQNYAVGSVWIDVSADQVYIAADVATGAAIWRQVSAGGGSGSAVKDTIVTANSFSTGNVVRRDAGGYALSQGDSLANAKVLGVIESANASQFTIVYSGKLTWTSHGLTLGTPLYLSPSTPGGLTTTTNNGVTNIYAPVAVPIDNNTLIVFPGIGLLVGAGSFNGASQLVQLDSSSRLPNVDASLLTDVPAFVSTKITVFTAASSTWTRDADCLAVNVEVQAGGGAGGGSVDANSAGGGGGAGGYSRLLMSATAAGASQTVTVGAGGVAVSGSGGGNGGASSFGALVSATGGAGGSVGANIASPSGSGGGGQGGAGASGDVNINGQNGNIGFGFNTTQLLAGAGGASVLGHGGVVYVATTTTGGVAGTGYGAGGSGSITASSGGAQIGGAGSQGVVIVTEYLKG